MLSTKDERNTRRERERKRERERERNEGERESARVHQLSLLFFEKVIGFSLSLSLSGEQIVDESHRERAS